jgi:hypothetical protein
VTADAPSGEGDRPFDDEIVPMDRALRLQREYVLAAGSPVAGLILQSVADDIVSGGDLAAVLPASARFGDFPGLRLMACVHRLALERRAPRVALRLPTLGGIAPQYASERMSFRADVVRLLLDHVPELEASLARTPQTNEPGRAALLRCALSRLDPTRPVRLREIGASAGLNLRADLLPGLPDLESGPLPSIVDRLGCDLDPVDAGTTEGRNVLTSFVWVDDVSRFERLRQALAIAAKAPARVVRQDAAGFCSSLALAEGAATVLWHSAMWVYLDPSTRSSILASIESLGRRATPSSPLAHVSWEWPVAGVHPDFPFSLVMRTWNGDGADGRPRLIARGNSHATVAELVPADLEWPGPDPLSD